MIKIEDLKEGQRVIYFREVRHYGYHVDINWNFNIVIKKILKTKVKTECGKEFKIENGKIDNIYPSSDKEYVKRTIIDIYKEQLKKEVDKCSIFKLTAYMELVEEKITNWRKND